MKNKQAKHMLLTIYQELFSELSENRESADRENAVRRVWAFDRLRLCEMGFDRQKLRFPNISKVSIKGEKL